jgi:hypothetical protein
MASPRDCTVCATSDVAASRTSRTSILNRNKAKSHSVTADTPVPAAPFPAMRQSSCPDQSPIRR